MSRLTKTYGLNAVDWEQRTDFDRLRRERLARARAALDTSEMGGLLLFDSYLRPGLAGIAVPFTMSYRPVFTGLGIIAGWTAATLGLTFYVRRWIGTRTWRMMHRFTILAYGLAVVHVAGAGTDARHPWMIALLTLLIVPVAFLFTYRVFPSRHARTLAVRSP